MEDTIIKAIYPILGIAIGVVIAKIEEWFKQRNGEK